MKTFKRKVIKRHTRKLDRAGGTLFKSKTVVSWGSIGTQATCYINFNGLPDATNTTSCIRYTQGGGLFGQAFPDTDHMASIYNDVRMAAVKLKFIPAHPTSDSSSSYAYTPVYVCQDNKGFDWVPDSATPVGNELLLQQRCSVKNSYKPWKMYLKSFKSRWSSRIPILPVTGTTTDASTYNYAGVWHNTNVAIVGSADNYGAHVLALYAGLAAAQVGQLVITGYFMYRDKKISGI